jgi:uncharacterized membrane protein
MPGLTQGRGVKVERTVTIARPAAELFRFWRHFDNLPGIMPNIASVTTVSPTVSPWVGRGPAGTTVEWDAEVVADRQGELIAWRSVGDSDLEHGGSVQFVPAPGDRGTEVKVVLNAAAPAGPLGHLVALVFGKDPDREMRETLRRFKQLMEAGELPTAGAQTSARRAA